MVITLCCIYILTRNEETIYKIGGGKGKRLETHNISHKRKIYFERTLCCTTQLEKKNFGSSEKCAAVQKKTHTEEGTQNSCAEGASVIMRNPGPEGGYFELHMK